MASGWVSVRWVNASRKIRSAKSKVSSGVFFFELDARQGNQQMRDCYQTHVVMPTRPTTRFILRHPQVALAVLQIFFDPKATTADQRQGLQPHLRRRVGDVVLELRLGSQRTPNHQPNRRTRLAVPHRPDSYCRELKHQRATRTFTQLVSVPGVRGQTLCERLHRAHAVTPRTDRPTASTLVRRHFAGRVLRPHRRRRGHIHQVTLTRRFQVIQERAVAAIGVVGSNPVKPNRSRRLGSLEQAHRDLRLGLKANLLGYMNFGATFFVLGPNLGQIQLVIQQGTSRGSNTHQEHTDLAVLFLAKPTTVLPLHAHAFASLFGKAGTVEDADGTDRPVGRAGNQLLSKDRLDYVLDVLIVPGRLRKKALQIEDLVLADAIVVGFAKGQGDRFGALAFAAQEQAVEIDQGLSLRLFATKERQLNKSPPKGEEARAFLTTTSLGYPFV